MKKILRQGDVLVVPADKLPDGCKDITPDKGPIVLAFGEVTGHSHAIADHVAPKSKASMKDAGRIARNVLARMRARLLEAPDGRRFLEVTKPVTLRHEEHSPHKIPSGLYEIPLQMEHTTERVLRRVAD